MEIKCIKDGIGITAGVYYTVISMYINITSIVGENNFYYIYDDNHKKTIHPKSFFESKS